MARWAEAVVAVSRSVVDDLRRAISLTLRNKVAGSIWTPRILRWALYRVIGMDVRTPKIGWHCIFMSRNVSIGPNALVQWGVVFEGGPISIGANTMVGQQAIFITADHPRDEYGRASLDYVPVPITVGADCWLGARVTVLGGVTIADRCIVGAGSVVTRDLLEPGVYAGSPARLVRTFPRDPNEQGPVPAEQPQMSRA